MFYKISGGDCNIVDVLNVISRAGNDLLSRDLSQSTIGAKEFNGRVRDGIGFRLLAIITCSANYI